MFRRTVYFVVVLILALLPFASSHSVGGTAVASASGWESAPAAPSAQGECHLFVETQKQVCGRFLQYWNEHGGLAQQGFPLSDVVGEVSQADGKLYSMQYFERAVFEYHPENKPPTDVLLSQLGRFRYAQKYRSGAPNQQPNQVAPTTLFPETGQRIGGNFAKYWQSHGGLAQQGFPLSDEFIETNELNGQVYRVQYFERAVFEWHPELVSPNDILLSQLGRFRYNQQSTAGVFVSPPVAIPAAIATPTSTPTVRPTSVPPTRVPTARPPTPRPIPTTPPSSGQRCGATCRDGSHSNATGSGACSHHGGVDHWLYCEIAAP